MSGSRAERPRGSDPRRPRSGTGVSRQNLRLTWPVLPSYQQKAALMLTILPDAHIIHAVH